MNLTFAIFATLVWWAVAAVGVVLVVNRFAGNKDKFKDGGTPYD